MKKILIIEDSKTNIKIMTDVLEAEGYIVYSLMDATKVLSVVTEYKPDTILLDIVMPKMDGIEVCTLLKENDFTKNIPIIMVTSITDSSILKTAFEIGAFDYIKKPFDSIEIIARIKSAIRYHEQQKKLENLVWRDGLTNIYNHRAILNFAEKEYQRSIIEKTSFAFLMLDIDYFKKVNDTYGHMVGDCVLEVVATIIDQFSIDGRIIGRYGGEEFCCISVGETFEEIKILCERIRISVERYVFKCENYDFNISVSIGVAYKTFSSDIILSKVIALADKKLYEAKNNGRNRVEVQEI